MSSVPDAFQNNHSTWPDLNICEAFSSNFSGRSGLFEEFGAFWAFAGVLISGRSRLFGNASKSPERPEKFEAQMVRDFLSWNLERSEKLESIEI